MQQSAPRLIGELTAAIANAIPDQRPVDDYLVELAARRLVQLRQIGLYIEERRGGRWIDASGRVARCLTAYGEAEKAFGRLADQLGISPTARVRLLADASGVQREVMIQELARRRRDRARLQQEGASVD